MSKNLVLLTCALNVQKDSVFTLEERFKQVHLSIQSIRRKIPDSYIVLVEIGTAPEQMIDSLKQIIDEYISMNVEHLNKNQGEASMMYKYLKSENFQLMRNRFVSFNKLSGRYFLNDDFDFFKYPLDKALIKQRRGESGEGLFETRYFRFPIDQLDSFISHYDDLMINKIRMLEVDDVEHIYFHQGFFTLENTISNVAIGVSGWVSGSGNFITD